MPESLLVKYRRDPYLSLKLTGVLAGSLICGVGAAALPEKPRSELTGFDKALKSLAAVGTIIGGGGAIAATIRDESQNLEQKCAQAVQDHLTIERFRSEGSFYRNYDIARKMGISTPEEWHTAYVEVEKEISQQQLPVSAVDKVKLPRQESEARSLAEKLTNPGFLELDRQGLIDKKPPQAFYTSDRYAEVRSLANEGTILIVGGQGSGKTEKLGWLMATHCRKGHWVWFINPFAPAAHYKGLYVLGRGRNFLEVAEGLRAFTKEAQRRIELRGLDENYDPFNELHIHLAIDELSDYEAEVAKYDDGIMQEFWAVCTQFLRQANMSVSLVSHGDTQAMMGGGQQGKSKAIKRNIVRLYCQWKVDLSVRGGRRCAGWAQKVTMKANGQEAVTRINIPEWMVAPSDYNYEGVALKVEITSEPNSQIERNEGSREVLIPDINIEPIEPSNQRVEPAVTQSGQGVQNIGDLLEPVREPQENALEPAFSAHSLDLEPEPETEVLVTPLEKSQFAKLKAKGMNKAQVIDFIWDCKKGKSRRYEEASLKYEQLVVDWEGS